MSTAIAYINVASDDDLSTVVESSNRALMKIQIPQAFTSTAITLQGSNDGVNFSAIKDTSQSDLTITVAAGGVYSLDPVWTYGVAKIKIATGSNEAADRQIILGFLDA